MSNNSFPPEILRKTHKNDLHHYVPSDNRKNTYYNGQAQEDDQDDRFGGFVFTKKQDHKYPPEGKFNAYKTRQNPKQKYSKQQITRSEPQPSERHISELEKLQQQLAQNGINLGLEDPLSQPPGLEKESDFNEVLMLMEQSSLNYEQQFNNEFNKKSKPKKKKPKQNHIQQFVLPNQDFDPLASIPVQFAPIQSKQEIIPQIPQIPQGVPFGIGDYTYTPNGPVLWGAGFSQQTDCPSGPQLNLGPEYNLNGPVLPKEQPKERKKLNINAKPLNY